MKHVAVALLLGMLSTQVMAQTDTVNLKKGTTIMKIGNMTIIKPVAADSSKTDTLKIGVDTLKMGSLIIVGKGISEGISKLGKALEGVDLKKITEDAVQGVDIKKIAETASDVLKKKKPKKVSTNWLVYDIGFAGYNDNTNYATSAAQAFVRPSGIVPASKGDFALKSSRVSNFNLWFFMQRVSIIESVLNLKYGLGIESNNYFFKTGITYVDDISVYALRGGLNELSKNKLVANYLTVPVMLKIREGRPNVVDFIKNGEVKFILNTPTGQAPREDEVAIRSAATAARVPVMTTLRGARASTKAIQAMNQHGYGVKSLQEFHA